MGDGYRHNYEEELLLDSNYAPGGVVVYYADGDEEILHVNRYIVDLFGCNSVDEFLEFVRGSFAGFVYEKDLNGAQDAIRAQAELPADFSHVNYRINYRIRTKAGKLVYVEDYGRVVGLRGSRPVYYAYVAKKEQRGRTDWLTGLPSMAQFHMLADIGAQDIRAAGDAPVAVALDFMGMKSFNAEYGRREGDKLLIVFADLLRKHFGDEGCSRFGEDHFYAFAPQSGIDERMRQLFSDFAHANDGKVLPVRAGAYQLAAEDDIIVVGFDRAKLACESDKGTWQSHVTWFTDEMRAQAHMRMHLIEHLDQAIAENWVRPYYQPIVRAATGRVCAEEALARWNDPQYGQLSPALFIPVLEEAGLLQKLDMHMVDCILEDFARKERAGVTLVPVSVNFSLRDLEGLDFADAVRGKVDAAGVPHSYLRVEFTESAASEHPDLFRTQVALLREAGLDVWMDDFGSGYSSLNMVQEQDFDLVKLDMGLVQGIADTKPREVIMGVVRAAKRLGVGALAEGVETPDQAELLKELGCDMLQGYLYSRPVPLETVIERVRGEAALPREDIAEASYYASICAIDLDDPMASIDARTVEGASLIDFPACIVEHRDGCWHPVRLNQAYRDYLEKVQGPVAAQSGLETGFTDGEVDEDFLHATQRSVRSGAWERVSGREEFGSGLQVYIYHLASGPYAEAYMSLAIPSTLGSALGVFGDVPVAYAVLKVTLDEAGGKAADAEYLYANSYFYEWGAFEGEDLVGASLRATSSDAEDVWLPQLYRAITQGESVQDTLRSRKTGHWLSYNLVPSPVPDCCVFAFTIADEEYREREEIVEGRNTSDLIVSILDAFVSEIDYETAMGAMLAKLSSVVHPEHMILFERGREKDLITFEWRADETRRQVDLAPPEDADGYSPWDSFVGDAAVVFVPDTSVLVDVDPALYGKLEREGVNRLLAASLRYKNVVLGTIVAENYTLEEGIDVPRLLETIASFISTRIANHQLFGELERSDTHNALIDALNRYGA